MLERIRGAWLPVWAFLGAYVATTVIGATIVLTPGGRARLGAFLGKVEPLGLASIGSFEYYTLLYLPLLLAPLCAYLGMRVAAPICRHPRARTLQVQVSRLALFGMTVLAGAYCFVSLARVGKLLPRLLFDPAADYQRKMIERAELMSLLRPEFYAVVFAILPTLAACFLARFLLRGRQFADGAGFFAAFWLCYYFGFTIYMKAPFLLLAVMLGVTVIVARANWLYLPALAAVSAAAFLCMQVLLGGFSAVSESDSKPGWSPAEAGVAEESGSASVSPTPEGVRVPRTGEDGLPATAPARGKWEVRALLQRVIGLTGGSIIFRMASSFPFYVDIFRDPGARCGLQTDQLPLLPTPECTLPTKVFERMYPQIDWTKGFAPAAAHVSAYGEVGLGYGILVMVLSGFLLGFLGSVGQMGRGPLFVAFKAVLCMFAYYLTQVPLIGAFLYGHGLVFYLTPIGILALLSFLRHRQGPPRRFGSSLDAG